MRGKSWIVLVAATIAASIVAVGWSLHDRHARDVVPEGILVASGRLEGRTVRVAAQAFGRVTRLAVREGDPLAQGDLIAVIDARDATAAVTGGRAGVAAAEAGAVAAERRVAALEARLELARKEQARYQRLFERDAAPRQAVDRADAELEGVLSELRAAQAAHVLALRQTDVVRAQLESAEVRLAETTIAAPVGGVVTAELARAGETVAPGVPVVAMLMSDDMKLRVYLPLEAAQRVQPGHEARIYVDGYHDRFFDGVVERVASQAEFTPKDVHMPDERSTLVFAVDVRVPNPDGTLKDNFPADAYIRWKHGIEWPTRRPW
jgi:HlyD family secretion protein